MLEEQASERDLRLMDEVLREARTDLAHGGARVAALLASPDQIIAVAHNTIQETGDLTNHAEMVLLHGMGRELPLPKINQQLVRGPFALVPGVRRKEAQDLLRRMNKAADAPISRRDGLTCHDRSRRVENQPPEPLCAAGNQFGHAFNQSAM
jgi:hypothetical protein